MRGKRSGAGLLIASVILTVVMAISSADPQVSDVLERLEVDRVKPNRQHPTFLSVTLSSAAWAETVAGSKVC